MEVREYLALQVYKRDVLREQERQLRKAKKRGR